MSEEEFDFVAETEKRWQEYLEEYKDDKEVIAFMNLYGYVPFRFEIEEWREDEDYPFK